MASDTLVSTLHAQLEEERDLIVRQLAELQRFDGGSAYDENFADSGQVAAEQGEARVLANSLQSQLKEVERALAKIDAGTYGAARAADARSPRPGSRRCRPRGSASTTPDADLDRPTTPPAA